MRRATFMSLTGYSTDGLKNDVRGQKLPFAAGGDSDGAGYSYRQAFAARLAIELGQFLDRRQACIVVENYLDPFVARFKDEMLKGEPVYFGFARHIAETSERVSYDSGLIAGPLDNLLESKIVDDPSPRIALVALGSQKATLMQACFVNATRELDQMRRAAADHPLATAWMGE